jgi:Arc/MetJ-type ribon-helix-helix transcriptional regulator
VTRSFNGHGQFSAPTLTGLLTHALMNAAQPLRLESSELAAGCPFASSWESPPAQATVGSANLSGEVRQMSTTIQVPDEIARQVMELFQTGAFPDSDSAVREAFRLLDEKRQRQQLRELVAEADAEVTRGESDEWTDELNQRLVREAQDMIRS